MNYDESVVFVLYALTNGPTDTRQDVDDFDAQLFNDFDQDMREICEEDGVEPDSDMLSEMLGCRPFMPGGTNGERLRSAFQFIRKMKP